MESQGVMGGRMGLKNRERGKRKERILIMRGN